MKLLVNNRDRSADLGAEIAEAARRRAGQRSPEFYSPELSALVLRGAGSEAEYLENFIRLARERHGVSLDRFQFPPSSGFLSACTAGLRKILWKLIRPPQEYAVSRQNAVNEMLIHALELQATRHRQELDRLQATLREIRDKMSSP